ncbi:hypothetical protein LY76DRAFT_302418 [Colletotrichum caudatum]|nr:hypothetical protein LY76DRAFT_302418 [Colletotrichum caudatum]
MLRIGLSGRLLGCGFVLPTRLACLPFGSRDSSCLSIVTQSWEYEACVMLNERNDKGLCPRIGFMDAWAWPAFLPGLGAWAGLQGISLMGSPLSNVSLSASCIRTVAWCSLSLKFSY